MLYNVKTTDCPDNNTKLVNSIASSSENGTSPRITRCILIRRTYSNCPIDKKQNYLYL
jgi:hypothetical protein